MYEKKEMFVLMYSVKKWPYDYNTCSKFKFYWLTISVLEASCCFIAFSWTLPIAPSAHRAKEIKITPIKQK